MVAFFDTKEKVMAALNMGSFSLELKLSSTGAVLIVGNDTRRSFSCFENNDRVILMEPQELFRRSSLPANTEIVFFTRFVSHSEIHRLKDLIRDSEARLFSDKVKTGKLRKIVEQLTSSAPTLHPPPQPPSQEKVRRIEEYVRKYINLNTHPTIEGRRLFDQAKHIGVCGGMQYDDFYKIFFRVGQAIDVSEKMAQRERVAHLAPPESEGINVQRGVVIPDVMIAAGGSVVMSKSSDAEATHYVAEAFGRGTSYEPFTDAPAKEVTSKEAREILSEFGDYLEDLSKAIKCLLQIHTKG